MPMMVSAEDTSDGDDDQLRAMALRYKMRTHAGTAQIRPATVDDAETIARLVRKVWAGKVAADSTGHRETADQVRKDLEHGFGLILEMDGEPIGTVRMKPHPTEPGVWEAKRLGVISDYQKEGWGPRLMAVLEAEAVELGVEELRLAVRPDQPRLVEWYTGLGFTVDPSKLYSSPNPAHEPEVVMVRVLGDPTAAAPRAE